jgi:ribonuclease HI
VSVKDQELPRGIAAGASLGPVTVTFDGAFEVVRGRRLATYGFTIDGPGVATEESGLAVRPDSENATNNVAEYVGAIRALERLHGFGYDGPVEVRGDSQLVIRQMRGEYAVRADHLKGYHDRLVQLAATFARVEWVWVRREENVRADALSKEAIFGASL